ncbi:MAG: 3-deoxy-7-phosphoheptulonate synthase, partial [Acidobacteriota bacterium]
MMVRTATEEQIRAVVDRLEALGLEAGRVPVQGRVTLAVSGGVGRPIPEGLELLPGVLRAIPLTRSYPLADRDAREGRSVVRVGGVPIGSDTFTVIAGPCAVESEDQVLEIARQVRSAGAHLLRGGAFKPRSSPYSFQGLGEEGLRFLARARNETGLPVVTEAMDADGVKLVEEYADAIQIGARNMQNYALLRAAGRARKPVFLKRGMSATLEDLLLSAEYVLAEGNPDVFLCERGIRTFAGHARNTLDLSIVPAVQRCSHLPI